MNRYCEFTDEELIQRYLSGDNSAFTRLVYRHKDRIFTTIVLLVKDRTLAEDIFQETFIKIVNALKAGHYTDNHRFVAWAARIASFWHGRHSEAQWFGSPAGPATRAL